MFVFALTNDTDVFSIEVMRTIWRTLDRAVARDVALVLVADGIVGVSFGAIAVSGGLPIWLPMLLSVFVFAGGAQFLFVGIIASGGSPVAAALAGLLVNARHIPFGFAVSDLLGKGVQRLLGIHVMIDETVAFAMAQQDSRQRRAVYWACGIGLFVCWNVGVVIGAVAGTVITDTAAFGLDAAFPAVLFALVLPSLKEPATRTAAMVGAAVALATTPFVSAGLPVLLALAGIPVAALVHARLRGKEPAR